MRLEVYLCRQAIYLPPQKMNLLNICFLNEGSSIFVVVGYSCIGCGRSCMWIWTSRFTLVSICFPNFLNDSFHFALRLPTNTIYCHWIIIQNITSRGNILLRRGGARATIVDFTLEGKKMSVSTFGLTVSIIDFTLSRINTGNFSFSIVSLIKICGWPEYF